MKSRNEATNQTGTETAKTGQPETPTDCSPEHNGSTLKKRTTPRVKYIESTPVKQIIEFDSREEYHLFFNKRIKEIIDYTWPNKINYKEYFQYQSILLNKDGRPRKHIDCSWLHSKKARKKQRKNFAIYCEKRKMNTISIAYRRKLAEIDFKIGYWQRQKSELIMEYHTKYGNKEIKRRHTGELLK